VLIATGVVHGALVTNGGGDSDIADAKMDLPVVSSITSVTVARHSWE
jgi:hypothetical protein